MPQKGNRRKSQITNIFYTAEYTKTKETEQSPKDRGTVLNVMNEIN